MAPRDMDENSHRDLIVTGKMEKKILQMTQIFTKRHYNTVTNIIYYLNVAMVKNDMNLEYIKIIFGSRSEAQK